MPDQTPKTAMILAAGRGERMRPLTDHRPKPLIDVAGRAIIDHIFDHLRAAGVTRVIVNIHHMGEQLRSHLALLQDLEIDISDETEALMETGGGLVKARQLLGQAPVFVINGDAFWLDYYRGALARLADAFARVEADIFMLLEATANAVAYQGQGDFFMAPDGRLSRRPEPMVAPFVYTGICIIRPAILEGQPSGPFSANRLYDQAAANDRLFGLRHEGLWAQLNTPEAVQTLEMAIGS